MYLRKRWSPNVTWLVFEGLLELYPPWPGFPTAKSGSRSIFPHLQTWSRFTLVASFSIQHVTHYHMSDQTSLESTGQSLCHTQPQVHIAHHGTMQQSSGPTSSPILSWIVTFLVVLDFLTHADTSDCLVFLLLHSLHRSCVLFMIWILLYDTILMATCVQCNLSGLLLYDINLRATTMTSLSTRGVMIPIDLVISTTWLFTGYCSSI